MLIAAVMVPSWIIIVLPFVVCAIASILVSRIADKENHWIPDLLMGCFVPAMLFMLGIILSLATWLLVWKFAG